MEDVARHTRLKRRGSTYWFKAKVPKALQGEGRFVTSKGAPKTEEAFSLRTRDPAAAKRAVVEASLRFDQECDQLRRTLAVEGGSVLTAGQTGQAAAGSVVSLSWRQCVALAGRWLAREVETYEAHPDNQGHNELGLDWLWEDAGDHRSQAEAVAPYLDQLLRDEGFQVDGSTRRLLVSAMFEARRVHLLSAVRADQGDFSPAPEMARYPAWVAPQAPAPHGAATPPVAPQARPPVTVDDIVKGWKADTQGTAQMADVMSSTLQAFADHVVKAEPAGRTLAEATKADAVAWKASLQAAGRAPSTVFTYMSRASTMLKWAASNGLVPLNPLQGVTKPTQKRGKGKQVRPFYDDEAVLILADARNRQGAARWLPWVQAFSGARISEVAQASAADVWEVDGIPCLVVTDVGEDGELVEGKSVKSEAGLRTIPLHPQVIAEGFLEYARSVPQDGALFPELRPDKYGRRGTTASGMIADIVRGLGITDKKVATSHSWRHRVSDQLRNALVPADIKDAILGHETPRNAGDGYGLGFSVTVLADAVAKIPAPAGLASTSGGTSGGTSKRASVEGDTSGAG